MSVDHDGDVAKVVARCQALLGPAESWVAPAGYPDGLALCVLDSVWSIGVQYGGVVAVLRRYRSLRTAGGADADRDGLTELAAVIDRAGGPDVFAVEVANRQRTSTRGGILKAEAVLRCARGLIGLDVASTAGLLGCDADRLIAAQRAWCAVPGQRSGISWRYLRLLAGAPDVKPDRMIIRFVQAAIGRVPPAGEAAALVTAAAASLDADVRGLDHRMWKHQSGRG
jgi:hypothetical protein